MNTVMRLETKTGELEVHLTIFPDGSSERTNGDDTIRLTPSKTRKMVRELERIMRMPGDSLRLDTYTYEDEAGR